MCFSSWRFWRPYCIYSLGAQRLRRSFISVTADTHSPPLLCPVYLHEVVEPSQPPLRWVTRPPPLQTTKRRCSGAKRTLPGVPQPRLRPLQPSSDSRVQNTFLTGNRSPILIHAPPPHPARARRSPEGGRVCTSGTVSVTSAGLCHFQCQHFPGLGFFQMEATRSPA